MKTMLPVLIGVSLALADARAIAEEHDSEQAQVPLAIKEQSLRDALNDWAHQTGFQIVSEIPATYVSPGIKGNLTPTAALERLLLGTPFIYEWLGDRTVAVRPHAEQADEEENVSSEHEQTETTSDTEQPSSSDLRRRSSRIETVIVTAQKRVARAQDVPISVSVINNQDIERRGLIGMEDYLRAVPGVNQIDNGAQTNGIVIRGITTSPQFENFSSGTTVASYFDETPITAAAGLGAGGVDIRPADLERIEILRGPQGTTYGSASLGGTVRAIPIKPKLDDFRAKVTGSYSNTSRAGGDNSMLQAVVNAPVIDDKFGLRAVGYRYNESGFYRNVAGSDPTTIAVADSFGFRNEVLGYHQDDVGRMISTGGRLAALWRATNQLNVSVNLLTQTIEQDGAPVATVGRYEQTRWPVAAEARVRATEPGETADTEIDLLNATFDYQLRWGTVTSTASWVDSGSAAVTALVPTLVLSGTFGSDFKSFTSETRFVSQVPGRIQFLAGFFYEDVEEGYLQVSRWLGSDATNIFQTNPVGITSQTRDLRQRAVFGEVSYDLTPKFTTAVGVRLFEYERDETQLSDGGIFGTPLGAGTRAFRRSSETNDSLRVDVRYRPNDDSLLYGSWAEGFRLGRPSAGLPSATCDRDSDGIADGTNVTIESTRTIDSDFLESYEIGGKLMLLDQRLFVEASVYHIDWHGLPTRTSAPSCGVFYTANVGEATSDGLELQTSLLVSEGLRLDLGASYNKAELSAPAPALGAKKGAPLPGSPRTSANLAAQYDFKVVGHDAFVRVDSLYSGKFYGNLLESAGTLSGGYVKVDMRTGVTVRNLNLEFFVKNVTNEDAYTWRGLTVGSAFFGYRLRPRTVGIQLGYSFH